ncbi:MAG: hypothetical protein FWD58_10925 [Firmicutes bacterium]|nr:hypothetical protein [Bacillota bacterium]
MLLSSCKIPFARNTQPPIVTPNEPPISELKGNSIFSDGIWDGYDYVSPYVEQEKNASMTAAYLSNPAAPNPAYLFKFGLRNEESECLFSDAKNAYINISYGFVKTGATGYSEDITTYIERYEIDVYLVNNLSDYLEYFEVGVHPKYDFSNLTPTFTITDFFLPEEKAFNDDYACVVKPSPHGDYYGFTHSQKAFIPQEVFNFSTGNLTAIAIERLASDGYETENIRSIHAAYAMNAQNVRLKNYVKPGLMSLPHIGMYGNVGSDGISALNYDGGNLAVSLRPNELVAKIDDCYYAVYGTPFNPDPYVMWPSALNRWYVLKKGGVVYYKKDLTQTFWKPGVAGVNNVVDPELLFLEAISYKIEAVKDNFEKQGVVFTLSNFTQGNDNGVEYKQLNISSEGRGVVISFFADGWVSDIRIYSDDGKVKSLNIKYFPGFDWDDAHIDSNRIVFTKD